MPAEELDKPFKRYIVIAFIITAFCVMIADGLCAMVVAGVLLPAMADAKPAVAFILAQTALVLLVLPVVLGAFAFSRITRHRLASELEAAERERKRYYAQRNLMLSDIAHDLRTPVMGISSLAQALEEDMVEDEAARQRYLHSIVTKSAKMGDLATMLFDYIKLESEGFALQREPIDLSQLLLNEAAALYTDAEDAGMPFLVEVPEDPAPIWADKAQMARVVSNLISNAIRHNPPGTTIALALVRKAGIAQIVVADSGEPIEGDPSELFEPFARGDSARPSGSTGLGLSIVKTIADMHGYRLSLQQPYGTFTKAFTVACSIDHG